MTCLKLVSLYIFTKVQYVLINARHFAIDVTDI